MTETVNASKFGTFRGVFVPNITMMFGVILFLRLPLIVSSTGLWPFLSIVGLSLLFMLITSFSIASIATNMEVGTGGVYYLITRTLGIEVGGAVGFMVYVSQLINISLTITGFAYLFCDQYPNFTPTQVEVVTLILLSLFASFSTSLALKAQTLILFLILLGVGSVFFGSPANLTLPEDLAPFYKEGQLTFWAAFALFYPAMTGIEAGMALSGSLKNPARSLSWGNIGSLIFVAVVYSVIAIYAFYQIPLAILKSNPFAVIEYAYSSNIVILGVYCATISSALGALVGAPRILQSIAEDAVLPGIFAKTYGKYQEPVWGLLFTSSIAMVVIVTTTLDQILPILTMICLITYGMLNFISGVAELMNTPSWRPQFRVPWPLSFTGAFLSLFLMFILSPEWSFAAIFLIGTLFVLLQRRGLQASFQDLRESFIFFLSRMALYRLASPTKHAIVWHPQLLAFIKTPNQAEKLTHFTHHLTSRSGILTIASVVSEEMWSTNDQIEMAKQALENYFTRKKIKCLTEVYPAPTTHEGTLNLIKAFGIGPIQPNTIILGAEKDQENYNELVEIIQTCQVTGKNFILFCDSDRIPDKRFIKHSRTKPKRIDLWWDGTSNETFDLSLSLVTTLYDSRAWRPSKVLLNAISPHTDAGDSIQKYIQNFLTKSRLNITPNILYEKNVDDYLPYLQKYSEKADLTCICLRPYGAEESAEEYEKYLSEVMQYVKDLGVCILIGCYDQVDHSEIYQYPD